MPGERDLTVDYQVKVEKRPDAKEDFPFKLASYTVPHLITQDSGVPKEIGRVAYRVAANECFILGAPTNTVGLERFEVRELRPDERIVIEAGD